MNLARLASYENIVLQCHNIPDADTLGSAFALQRYFEKTTGNKPPIVFGGPAPITKPSLVMMLAELGIEATHIKDPGELGTPGLLLTVDCQHGAGNVQKFDCQEFAVIDHHRAEIAEGELIEIRPALSSCATLVWDLLRAVGYDLNADPLARNALYYGLFTDTNGLSELRHPLDRDLADIDFDKSLIKKLKNASLTQPELDIVSRALENYKVMDGIGLFGAEPCDPNILGFTSDIAKQVDTFRCVIVYSPLRGGLKLSVRSCVREIMASEISAFLCEGKGSGGGNIEMAGGFLAADEDYLFARIQEYLNRYDLIYAGKTPVDFEHAGRYRKLPVPVGFVKLADLFQENWPITIRTLEGDVDLKAKSDLYAMIGVVGEVYPIKKETFEKSYDISSEPYSLSAEYAPEVIDRILGDKIPLVRHAKACVPKGEKVVRAIQVSKPVKVFTEWDTEKYFSGAAGSFVVANEGQAGGRYDDCYVVAEQIFKDSYEAI